MRLGPATRKVDLRAVREVLFWRQPNRKCSTAVIDTDNFARVEVASAAELWAWLEANHAQEESVWLVTYKKSVPERYVSTGDILDAVIAYGWVDGIRRKVEPRVEEGRSLERTMQLIAPRRAQHWARSYKERAARLEAEGRMREPGRAAIERSKASGMWTFMDDVDALVTPDDLAAALAKRPQALAFFGALPDSAKRFTLRWIKLAKTPATRDKRIATTVERSAAGEFVPGVRMG